VLASVEQTVGDGDAQDRVIGEAAALAEQREVRGLRRRELVDGPDDISSDRAQHWNLRSVVFVEHLHGNQPSACRLSFMANQALVGSYRQWCSSSNASDRARPSRSGNNVA